MGYFVYKLIPPRPEFARDMTEAEAKLMREHGAYWKELASKGIAIVFGPVSDPKGTWGLAVVEVKHEAEALALGVNDPTIKSDVGFQFDVYPMSQATLRQ